MGGVEKGVCFAYIYAIKRSLMGQVVYIVI